MATIIRDIHPDAVAHLAAGVGPEHVTGNVHDTVTTNAQGTANVIDALRQYAPKATLLFTSSSEVYGLCPDKLFDEVTSPLVLGPSSEPRWCYAASKLAAEHLVLAHGGIVARIFNTTGPGQSEAYVLPRFVGQALRGEALTVYGDGSQVRCFCHVQDTVDALVRLLEGYTNPAQEQHDRIYNIGSDFPLSVGKLASVVRMLVNPIVAIVQQSPAPAGGLAMPYRKPALSRICWGYGWHPTKSLEQIILDTKAWKDT
jgi:UDP-glucose 4-epimerase